MPCLSPAAPAFSFDSAPIPPTRARRALFPSGKGGDFWFSYARGFAPCIPGAEPGRHRSRGAYHALAGDLPGWSLADLAVSESAGVACLACRLPPLPLALILPPSPRPALAERSSPPGKGEIFGFLMQGASPLASPGLNPGGTGAGARITRPAGGLPGWLPADLAAAVPGGRLALFVACQPCLWFAFLPPSPRPPSRREGGD